jgi:hypothetical protein
MIPDSVETLLSAPGEISAQALLDDESAVFWVDWREDDADIVRYCEKVLKTGELSVEETEIEDDPGIDLHISFRGSRAKVPLTCGVADRHITIHALNNMLNPAYEVRVCVDSHPSDSLALLPLKTDEWKALEARYGNEVRWRFAVIQERPNLFTEAWGVTDQEDGSGPRIVRKTIFTQLRRLWSRKRFI